MERKVKRLAKIAARGLAVLGLGALGYLGTTNYLCYLNKQEFEAAAEEMRDVSRPGNKSYGLNYGFKTDSAVKVS